MPEIIVKLGDNVVHKYVFDKDTMSVGRARDNDIVIENLSVSRNHARIRKENGRYILTDLNSANGSYVNGVRVTRVEVMDDDVVSIGKHKLHFSLREESEQMIVPMIPEGADQTMLMESPQIAALSVVKGKQKDQKFEIEKYETFIGRASDNDIRLHDWFVSKKHAVIIQQGSSFLIKDLGSWRGTMVNGKNVRDCELKEGDEIQLGTTVLSFYREEKSPASQITGRIPEELKEQRGKLRIEESESPEAVRSPLPVEDLEDMLEEPEGIEFPQRSAEGKISTNAEDLIEEMLESEGSGENFENTEDLLEASLGSGADLEDEFEPFSEEELQELQEESKKTLQVGEATEETGEELLSEAGSEDLVDGFEKTDLAQEGLEEEEKVFSASFPTSPEEELELPQGLEAGEEREEDLPTSSIPTNSKSPQAVDATSSHEESDKPISEKEQQEEIAMWKRALKNRSRVIRREAARKLKNLTGRDYDWKSEPD